MHFSEFIDDDELESKLPSKIKNTGRAEEKKEMRRPSTGTLHLSRSFHKFKNGRKSKTFRSSGAVPCRCCISITAKARRQCAGLSLLAICIFIFSWPAPTENGWLMCSRLYICVLIVDLIHMTIFRRIY